MVALTLLTAILVSSPGPGAASAPQDDHSLDNPWEAARSLPPGIDRAKAFRAALLELAADRTALQPRLEAAWQAFMADHDAFRGEAARIEAEAMYEVAPEQWAAECLEGVSRRLGDYERADAVLAEQLARTEAPDAITALIERRAINAGGAGWRDLELDHLGRACARGGSDAYQMLGRLALAEGHRDRARALFRALVQRFPGDRAVEAPPWALMGWGLSLLPEPSEDVPDR